LLGAERADSEGRDDTARRDCVAWRSRGYIAVIARDDRRPIAAVAGPFGTGRVWGRLDRAHHVRARSRRTDPRAVLDVSAVAVRAADGGVIVDADRSALVAATRVELPRRRADGRAFSAHHGVDAMVGAAAEAGRERTIARRVIGWRTD